MLYKNAPPSEFTIKQVGNKCPPLPVVDLPNFCQPSFILGWQCSSRHCSRSALLSKSNSNNLFVKYIILFFHQVVYSMETLIDFDVKWFVVCLFSLQFIHVVRSSLFNLARQVGGKIGDNYIKRNMSRWIIWFWSISSIMHDIQKERMIIISSKIDSEHWDERL